MNFFLSSPKAGPEWKYQYTRKQDDNIYALNPTDPNSKEINCNKLFQDMNMMEMVHALPMHACMSFLDDEVNEGLTNKIKQAALAGDVAAQTFMTKREETERQAALQRVSPVHKKQATTTTTSILKKPSPSKKTTFSVDTSDSEPDEILDMKDSPVVKPTKDRPKRQSSMHRYKIEVVVAPTYAQSQEFLTHQQEKDCKHYTEVVFKEWRDHIAQHDVINGRQLDPMYDMHYFETEMRKLFTEKKSPARFVYFAELIRRSAFTHCYKFNGMTETEIAVLESVGRKYLELKKNNPTLRIPEIKIYKSK